MSPAELKEKIEHAAELREQEARVSANARLLEAQVGYAIKKRIDELRRLPAIFKEAGESSLWVLAKLEARGLITVFDRVAP